MGEKQNQPSALVHTRNTSLDLVSTRRKPMKKLASPLTLGVAVFFCTSMLISGHQNRFSFQTVIFPGDTFPQLLGINAFKKNAGSHAATLNKGFVLTFPNNITSDD